MRIAIVGYGKMGREIEKLAPGEGVEVVATYDVDRPIIGASAEPFDIAREFTTPGTVMQHVEWLALHGRSMVIGTTGWYSGLPRVREIVESHGVGLLYAPNFSIGVHLFVRLAREASRAFSRLGGYDVAVHETHHRMKADAPSGTALHVADAVLEAWDGKSQIITNASGAVPADGIVVSSSRIGSVVGEHTVRIESPFDSLSITHSAHNRSGFALGALHAAKWLAGRKGIYTLDDMLDDMKA
jgi:4-hydroxy-tetrahydrodipicolinate reductase